MWVTLRMSCQFGEWENLWLRRNGYLNDNSMAMLRVLQQERLHQNDILCPCWEHPREKCRMDGQHQHLCRPLSNEKSHNAPQVNYQVVQHPPSHLSLTK